MGDVVFTGCKMLRVLRNSLTEFEVGDAWFEVKKKEIEYSKVRFIDISESFDPTLSQIGQRSVSQITAPASIHKLATKMSV